MDEINALVIDNSIIMSWFIKSEATADSRELLENAHQFQVFVPSLWKYEFSNVLWKLTYIHKKQMMYSDQKIFQIIKSLAFENIDIDFSDVFDNIFPLAGKMKLTVYDSAYLYLALQKNIPLATFDKAMRQACKKLKIPLLI